MVASFVQETYKSCPTAEIAREVAVGISGILSDLEGGESYLAATSIGASSRLIQNFIEPFLMTRGFKPESRERVGLAEFRADFLLTVGAHSIVVEVERGKTTDNNMDMLDFWKAHIHGAESHLIIAVPVWYVVTNSVKPTFNSVCRRMSVFFAPANYTNVRSLHVVGY